MRERSGEQVLPTRQPTRQARRAEPRLLALQRSAGISATGREAQDRHFQRLQPLCKPALCMSFRDTGPGVLWTENSGRAQMSGKLCPGFWSGALPRPPG